MTIRIAFRVDASEKIGIGHVMRCLALARGLANHGADILFLCRDLNGSLIGNIEGEGFRVCVLPKGSGHSSGDLAHSSWLEERWEIDAAQCRASLSLVETLDWLVVDHYALDERWEREMRHVARKILAIDDIADRNHDCDLLLDQNLGEDAHARYATRVPGNCRFLLGPKFALLRPEFRVEHLRVAKRPGTVPSVARVLVFMGGADPSDETSKVLDAIAMLETRNFAIDLIVGAPNPRASTIRERCATIPRCEFHRQVPNMHQLMARADVGVCSAGSITWERCAVGLPAIVLSIAENQRRIGEEAARLGLCVYLGTADHVQAEDIAIALSSLVDSPETLDSMRKAALDLVDGLGVRRVVQALTAGTLHICVISDEDSWINPYLRTLIAGWQTQRHDVTWLHDVQAAPEADIAFFLGCGQLAGANVLARAVHNLVVHESALPEGRGWAPLTWQILEGRAEIPIVLIEAASRADRGDIYLSDVLRFDGRELCTELRDAQGKKTLELCRAFVDEYPSIVSRARRQEGEGSYFRRRVPEDSRLDPDLSLRSQFNRLRVADNDRYPAFFDLEGSRYFLKIERSPPAVKNARKELP